MLDNRLGIIDLTNLKVTIKQTNNSLKKMFLGGRGLNSYYLYNYIKPGIDPFSPENILIFGTGFLTGTLVPNSRDLMFLQNPLNLVFLVIQIVADILLQSYDMLVLIELL